MGEEVIDLRCQLVAMMVIAGLTDESGKNERGRMGEKINTGQKEKALSGKSRPPS